MNLLLAEKVYPLMLPALWRAAGEKVRLRALRAALCALGYTSFRAVPEDLVLAWARAESPP